MANRIGHPWSYWLGAGLSALVAGLAACYAGMLAYNRELEQDRIAVGVNGIVDGRIPLELPVYAVLGALAGWWAFRWLVRSVQRDRRD